MSGTSIRLSVWIASLLAATMALPQQPANPAKRDPNQSPASQRGPRTVTQQSYLAEQIRTGEARFTAQCGFFHGRDAVEAAAVLDDFSILVSVEVSQAAGVDWLAPDEFH